MSSRPRRNGSSSTSSALLSPDEQQRLLERYEQEKRAREERVRSAQQARTTNTPSAQQSNSSPPDVVANNTENDAQIVNTTENRVATRHSSRIEQAQQANDGNAVPVSANAQRNTSASTAARTRPIQLFLRRSASERVRGLSQRGLPTNITARITTGPVRRPYTGGPIRSESASVPRPQTAYPSSLETRQALRRANRLASLRANQGSNLRGAIRLLSSSSSEDEMAPPAPAPGPQEPSTSTVRRQPARAARRAAEVRREIRNQEREDRINRPQQQRRRQPQTARMTTDMTPRAGRIRQEAERARQDQEEEAAADSSPSPPRIRRPARMSDERPRIRGQTARMSTGGPLRRPRGSTNPRPRSTYVPQQTARMSTGGRPPRRMLNATMSTSGGFTFPPPQNAGMLSSSSEEEEEEDELQQFIPTARMSAGGTAPPRPVVLDDEPPEEIARPWIRFNEIRIEPADLPPRIRDGNVLVEVTGNGSIARHLPPSSSAEPSPPTRRMTANRAARAQQDPILRQHMQGLRAQSVQALFDAARDAHDEEQGLLEAHRNEREAANRASSSGRGRRRAAPARPRARSPLENGTRRRTLAEVVEDNRRQALEREEQERAAVPGYVVPTDVYILSQSEVETSLTQYLASDSTPSEHAAIRDLIHTSHPDRIVIHNGSNSFEFLRRNIPADQALSRHVHLISDWEDFGAIRVPRNTRLIEWAEKVFKEPRRRTVKNADGTTEIKTETPNSSRCSSPVSASNEPSTSDGASSSSQTATAVDLGVRENGEIETRLGVDGQWGDCNICFLIPADPMGCISCSQMVGCRICCKGWVFTSAEQTSLASCPLCRNEWGKTRNDVMAMKSLESRKRASTSVVDRSPLKRACKREE